MVKRILCLLLPLVFIGFFTACGSAAANTSPEKSGLSERLETKNSSSGPEVGSLVETILESAPQSSETVGEDQEEESMKMNVSANGGTVVFELNGSQASKDLYAQLPLTVELQNFSTNEKVFYPPEKLETSETPLAKEGGGGTLAYYAPWGDVVMFYDSYSPNGSLYELGAAISGEELIQDLSGTVEITAG